MMHRFAPLAALLVLLAVAGAALVRGKAVPASPLIGRPAPAIAGVEPRWPAVVNFFASWCLSCAAEQGALALVKQAPVYGVAYKDKPEATEAWLAARGNPFAAVSDDARGRAALEWGVAGVPETFVVDAGGTVRWRHAGPVTEDIVREQVLPLLAAGGGG